MSQDLETIDGNFITSNQRAADGGWYELSLLEGDKAKIQLLPSLQYNNLIRSLWEAYLAEGKKPEVLGHTLTNKGLVTETLHVIAPFGFYDSDYGHLNKSSEKFAYWLRSKMPEIGKRIGDEESGVLNFGLECILEEHQKRKAS